MFPMDGHDTKHVAFQEADVRIGRATDSSGALSHGVEHRLKIAW